MKLQAIKSKAGKIEYYATLAIGDQFDTEAETGCVIQSLPDAEGNFVGLDSDRIEREFCLSMINAVY